MIAVAENSCNLLITRHLLWINYSKGWW